MTGIRSRFRISTKGSCHECSPQSLAAPPWNSVTRARTRKKPVLSRVRLIHNSAGRGKFIVTRGLLEKANDEQLGGVMAHEVAHQDRGHVTELQTIGAGVGIASVLLDQISPLAGAIVPVAGDLLIAKPHGRQAEYEADAHAVTILRRSGMDGKAIMTNTLTWLKQTEGSSKGGFFATHPGTDDRIQKVQEMARWTFILLRPSHSATRWLYIPEFLFLTEQVSTNDVSRPGPKVRILPFHTIACLPLSRVIPDC